MISQGPEYASNMDSQRNLMFYANFEDTFSYTCYNTSQKLLIN